MTDRGHWLSFLYAVPDPFDSEEDGKKFRHEDLVGMSLAETRRESERLKARLLHDNNPDEWLFERLDRLETL